MARLRFVRHLGVVLVLGFALSESAWGQAAADRALVLVEAGRMALTRGNPAVALEKAEAALSLDAKMPEALAVAAEGAFRLGDAPKAKRYVDECLLAVTPEFRKSTAYKEFLKVAAEVELLPLEGRKAALNPPQDPKAQARGTPVESVAMPANPPITASAPVARVAPKDSSLWASLVERATTTSWLTEWRMASEKQTQSNWATSFRLATAKKSGAQMLEQASFSQTENQMFRWARVCYEAWEPEGDLSLATASSPLIRRDLGCRYWHRGPSRSTRFPGLGSSVLVGYARDWEEIRPPRPQVLARPLKTELGVLQQLLNGEPVDAHGTVMPDARGGGWVPARVQILSAPSKRVEPPAWSDQERAVFPAE